MYICEEGGPRGAEPRPASSLFLLALLNIIMHGRREKKQKERERERERESCWIVVTQ